MIRPLHNYLVIEPEQEKTGKIILTTEHQKEIAKVIAVAEDVKEIKIGDRILLKSFNVDEVEVEKQKVFIINADDVLAVIE